MSEEPRRSSETDGLSALLARFSLSAGVFFSGRLRGTTGHPGGGEEGHIHLVRRGRLTLYAPGEPPRVIEAPSLVLLARPARHRLVADDPHGAEIVCARLAFEGAADNPLLLGFPAVLVVGLEDLPGLDAILRLLFDEALEARYGHQATVDRLVEVLMVHLLRHCLDAGLVSTGLLAGLGDPKLARALNAMHGAPERDWSVERLADEAGMSRTTFAAAFKTRIGVAPGDYLAMLRLAAAKSALLRGRPLKAVSAAVGYRSTTAFARAFQRRVGRNPRDWLRAARDLPPAS